MGQQFFEGFFLQASLILALGAQNLFVLESGLRRHHQLAVSLTCFLCDLGIIMLGVMGTGAMLEAYPSVKIFFGVLGVIFLLRYGIGKLRTREGGMIPHQGDAEINPLGKSILQAVTYSVINPHAYLDGVVLIGGYASKYELLSQRVMVGLGASAYSLVWFLMLSSASSSLMPFLRSPKRMRAMVGVSGAVLIVLSLKLSVDVYGWVVDAMETDSIVSRLQH